jgi:hypothetical protein
MGDLLVRRSKVAPETLARALTLQSRLRAVNGAVPRTLGE